MLSSCCWLVIALISFTAVNSIEVIWTGFLPPKNSIIDEPHTLEVPENVITCAWDPTKIDHEGLGFEPIFRKDKDVRLYFQRTLHNSIDDAITALRAQANPNTPNRHLQLGNRLQSIQKIIAQDWNTEKQRAIVEGSSSTRTEAQAVLSAVDQAKQNAQKVEKPDHHGASDHIPSIIRLPSLSRLGKLHEATNSPNLKSPADTALGVEETLREKISKILREADPTQPDLEINSDSRSLPPSREKQLNMKEMIQSLAQGMTSPTRSKVDTPHSRAIRSAIWDALTYFAYFDPKAETELVKLYEKPENEAFLSAHVLNLSKRFISSDFNTVPLQKILSQLEVPKAHIQYADFFQFHDRFLKLHPVAQERFERLFREHEADVSVLPQRSPKDVLFI